MQKMPHAKPHHFSLIAALIPCLSQSLALPSIQSAFLAYPESALRSFIGKKVNSAFLASCFIFGCWHNKKTKEMENKKLAKHRAKLF